MRVTAEMIALNQPTEFNIYSESGKLLVSKGIIPYNQSMIDKILARQCYTTPYAEGYDSFEAPCSIDKIEELMVRLEVSYTNFITNGHNLVADITEISKDLLEALEHEPDQFIGIIHLRSTLNRAIFRTFQNSVLAVLAAKRLKWGIKQIEPLLHAGLTQNLGMYLLQLDLDKHEGELTSFHQQQIRVHPKHSVRLLSTMGVRDRSWVQAVLSHHEQMNGSGYPNAFFGKDIPLEARLLAVADRYASFVTPRVYREQQNGMKVMRFFLNINQGRYDQKMAKALISEIGVYPPGVIVKLKSGEVGVVSQRTQERTAPLVKAIWQLDDTVYDELILRDTRNEEHQIIAVLQHEKAQNLNPRRIWSDDQTEEAPLFLEEVVHMESGQEGKGVTLF